MNRRWLKASQTKADSSENEQWVVEGMVCFGLNPLTGAGRAVSHVPLLSNMSAHLTPC